ncbi:phytanoyl-CoA dioxygenase family protein [Sphingobium sp.]|uniref:phytanoyl-CoA dioxygenase family protein n=1 Tax=Sphingobium sp. TaxID=1912891 RepID=UPI003B3ACE21
MNPLEKTEQLAAVQFWAGCLLRDGYCIIPGLHVPETIAAIERDLSPVFEATPFGQGGFYGIRTKRFGSLLRRSRHVAELVEDSLIIGIAQEILGSACDRIQLNVAQAIEIHPGALTQLPHRDHDMWQGAKGSHEYLINVMWPITPFTQDNGATQIYPESHGAAGMAREGFDSPVVAECPPGSAILFLGSTLHGAGGNVTGEVRRAIVTGYSLGWLKPYENPWLAYPPAIARSFSPTLAALVGYAQHRPNLGNYEGQCPSILLRDDIPEHLAAIDALRPDQIELVEHYLAKQVAGNDRPWLEGVGLGSGR